MARKRSAKPERFTQAPSTRLRAGDLDTLKRNVSLEALCRSRGIELRRHGARDLAGKCPFHEEDEASFIVTPSKNLFHCMGCDAAGSVIDLVMRRDGLDFRQAGERLMTSTGLVTTAAAKQKEPQAPAVSPARAAQLLERVVAIYEKNFPECPEGMDYLKFRGLANRDQFAAHRAGYSNGRLNEILPAGTSRRRRDVGGPSVPNVVDELKAVGVLNARGEEHFTGCVVFPVTDVDGNLATLYGRFTNSGKNVSRKTRNKASSSRYVQKNKKGGSISR